MELPVKIKILAFLMKVFPILVPRKKGSSLIIPASWEGSLGDEAVLVGLSSSLKERKNVHISVLGWEKVPAWNHVTYLDGFYSFANIWGIPWSGKLKLVFLFARHENLYINGNDVIDGVYTKDKSMFMIELARLGNIARMKVTITGFSISENPDDECIKAINNLPRKVRLCLRDPVSFNRLKQHADNKLHLVADAAFLLPAIGESNVITKLKIWIDGQKEQNRTIVAFNINKHAMHQNYDSKVKSFIKELVKFDNTYEAKMSYVIVPHDFRVAINDLEICNKLFTQLPEDIKLRSQVILTKLTSSEVKKIISYCDFVLSGRMHVIIASLGVKTPAVGISYQGKFEGLYKHFNLDNLLFDPTQLDQPGKLSQFLCSCFDQREFVKKNIEKNLKHVIYLAKQNLG